LNVGGRDLDCYNSRLMLKISYANFLGLSLFISLQFNVEMCAAAKNCEKFTKTLILGVWGRSRSSKLMNRKKLVTSACLCLPATIFTLDEPMTVKWVNVFLGNAPHSRFCLRGIPLTSGIRFCHIILETPDYHMVKTPSLYLTWAWIGTGTSQTPR